MQNLPYEAFALCVLSLNSAWESGSIGFRLDLN